jgi:hypothetical protein
LQCFLTLTGSSFVQNCVSGSLITLTRSWRCRCQVLCGGHARFR